MASPTTLAIRVFVDSSVLIAGAISARGSARSLIIRSLRGDVTLYVSSFVLEETERNLNRKAPAALPAFAEFRELLPNVVDPDATLVAAVAQSVELKDAPIVAAAMKAEVDYLVSYDQRHLLRQRDRIRSNFRIAVVTPDEVLSKPSL